MSYLVFSKSKYDKPYDSCQEIINKVYKNKIRAVCDDVCFQGITLVHMLGPLNELLVRLQALGVYHNTFNYFFMEAHDSETNRNIISLDVFSSYPESRNLAHFSKNNVFLFPPIPRGY